MRKGRTVLALLLVLVMVLSLAGCSGKNQTTSSTGSSKKQTDVVVVGSGAAGLSAAIEAASQGAKVILLEKQSVLGGNTNFAEGIFGTDSPVQKQLGITADTKQMLRKEFEDSNYKINGRLWKDVFDASAANIAWLLDMGVKFETVTNMGDTEKTWHVYEGFGKNVISKHMKPKAEQLGVEIMLSTPAKEIIMDNGRAAGVKVATADGKELIIEAKAVIIATGGFAEDKEMVANLARLDVSQLVYRGAPGHTGDGIKMAQKVGAASSGTPIICLIGATLEGTGITSHMNEASAMEPTNLWVNQNSERFVNEDVIFHYTRGTNAILTQAKTFSVMDSNAINKLVNEGCILGFGRYVLPGTKLSKLNAEIQQAIDSKATNVFKADTLEELATKMGLDQATFLATVKKYNEYSANGVDSEFGKNAKYLNELKAGPFYAFNIKVNSLNSMGGIKIDEKGEVMNNKQEAIKGLYAAGMDVDGFTGDTYGVTIPGSDQGIAIATGRNSAINAIKYIGTIQ
jgi:fumarate reductase flavoprotein subunit